MKPGRQSRPVGAQALALAIALCTATLITPDRAFAAISFEEKTESAGHFDDSESWGASFGHLNDDLWPDLFVVNHRFRPSLFRNNGDGSFTNMALQVDLSRTWHNFPLADTHGGTWADFDSDGDQDLSITTGICCDGQLMVNDTGLLTESASTYGVADDREGRLPVWLDYNGDGQLDLSYMSGSTARVFEQTPTPPFANVSNAAGIDSFCWRNQYAILSDIDGDDAMEYICVREGNFPMRTLDFDGGVFSDNAYLPPDLIAHATDTAVGDFDGDLRPDILVMRGNLMPNQAAYVADTAGINTRVEGWITSGTGAGLRTIKFKTTGPVTITAHSNQVAFPWKVFRGAAGTTLPDNPGTNQAKTTWTMDPSNPDDHGLAYDFPGFDPDLASSRGTYAGYDEVNDIWTLTLVPGEQGSRAYYIIESTAEILALDLEGDMPNDAPIAPALLMNTGTGFVNEVWSRGDIGQQLQCVSAVTADFDNDMDLDLYMVCRGGVENIPNRLFENDGSGNFTEVSNAGGAAALVGLGLASRAGTGENVVTADYDLDGYVDLFVTNGLIMQPFGVGAQDQLFRNTGGNNHWVEIELKGTIANIEGIGAKLLVTTDPGGPNEKTQLRERNGGYHRWSQNHSRIHFGLADNTTFDLEIRWPSGTVDVLTGISADQIIEVTEGGALAILTPGPAIGDPALVSSDECGAPIYRASEDVGLFVWKDCDGTGEWHVELIGGDANAQVQQQGYVRSSLALSAVSGVSLESADILDNSIPETIEFLMSVRGGGKDAFNFVDAVDAATCLILPTAANEIYLGAKHVRAQSPLNLVDPGAPCVSMSGVDIEVDESAGTATMNVVLSAAATHPVSVDVLSSDVDAIASFDYQATNLRIDFEPGETQKSVPLTIIDDTEYEFTEKFVVSLLNPVGAIVEDTAIEVTVIDDDAQSSCGEPAVNPAVDRVLAVWRDCGTDNWHIRASAGGGTGIAHVGALYSDTTPTTITPVSFESNDVLTTDGLAAISFEMYMSGAGTDGIDLSVETGASLCLMTTDPSIPIIVGAEGTAVSAPFDLINDGNCVIASSVNVAVNEDDAVAALVINLSGSVIGPSSVDLTTVDGSAIAGDDYVASSTTLNIDAGDTALVATIALVDDGEYEADEYFSALLSNANGFYLTHDVIDITVVDDDADATCGQPTFNPANDKILAVYKDCGTNNWHLVATAGGETAVRHVGEIASSLPLSNVAVNSFEANDVLDTSVPLALAFDMKMTGSGTDGIDFSAQPATDLCLSTQDAGITVLVGRDAVPATQSVDLNTLGPCRYLSVIGGEAHEGDGAVVVNVTLSEAATHEITVDISTLGTSASAGSDFIDTTATLTFLAGETTKSFSVPLLDDAIYESTESFTVQLQLATGAFVLGDTATISIIDDDGSAACGEPDYHPATEKLLVVWKDCTDGSWHLRATAGGESAINHSGSIIANGPLNTVSEYSFEGNDVLTAVGENELIYQMWMSNNGVDGIDFNVAPTSDLCLFTDAASPGVVIGGERMPVATPISLNTLTSCITATLGDVSVDEALGSASVPVFLSSPAPLDIVFNLQSTGGSATAGTDYATVNEAITISAGESESTFDVAIVNDSDDEDDESFTITATSTAILIDDTAEVTILDDDGNLACGAPEIQPDEQALFVWRECGTNNWHMRATAGGGVGIQHEGTVTLSNGNLPSSPPFFEYSMEGIDAVSVDSTNTQLTYIWRMSANGVDGIDFDTTSGASLCLDVTTPGIPILLGEAKTVVSAPLDLDTQGACQ